MEGNKFSLFPFLLSFDCYYVDSRTLWHSTRGGHFANNR